MALIRTGYSFKLAVGALPDVVSRIKEVGWTHAPVTDRLATHSFTKWTRLCKDNGLRPVYGVELPVVVRHVDNQREYTPDYWTFLAIETLRPLHDLIYRATEAKSKGPGLLYAEALAAEGVVKIAGARCQLSEITSHDLYMGLSPAMPIGLYREAVRRGLPFLATSDNYYPRVEDLELYRVMLGQRSSTQTYPTHILSDDEWRDAVWFADDVIKSNALDNRDAALARCCAVMRKAELFAPPRLKSLRDLCLDGAAKLSVDLTDEVYSHRLDHELHMIEEKAFEDYFHILADVVSWARERMVVGPARGSSCGSLVCYLLGITTVDPIPYSLIFERFIDVSRADLPDVDVDFSDRQRDKVFQYVEDKFGKERVARLGTVNTFQPRSALNIVGTALRIPKWMMDEVANVVIQRSQGDARASSTLADTLTETDPGKRLLAKYPEAMIVARMEDHPASCAQHAAGIVVTKSPVRDHVAIDARNNAAMCDKYDAEEMNLLKVDALGLTQLSIFERTLELIGRPPVSGWLETLPRDDPRAFEVLNRGHLSGIFQFTPGSALARLVREMNEYKPGVIDKFEDIVALTALVRPGPLTSGQTAQWIERRLGKSPVTYPHEAFEPYLKNSLGIVIYQEDVLRIGREIGDLSWADVTALRKAMSKSLGREFFDKYGDRWKAGAVKRGIPANVLDKIWIELCSMGMWSFNLCVCGTTKIKIGKPGSNTRSGGASIAELHRRYETHPTPWIKSGKRKPWLVSLFPDNRGRPQVSKRIIKVGQKLCWKYSFDDGSNVTCTPDHRFIVNGRWCKIGDANIGDAFASVAYEKYKTVGLGAGHAKGKSYKRSHKGFEKGKRNPSYVNGSRQAREKFIARMHGKPCRDCGGSHRRMEAHHLDFNQGKDRPRALVWLCPGCHKKRHYEAGRRRVWGKGLKRVEKLLISRKRVGMKMCYDIEMPTHHNFVLQNGLVSHNSHSVAYGLVSYWCLYLKAYYPIEFAAATLDAELPERQLVALREMRDEGVDYVPIDPVRSTDRWQVDGRRLIGPLTNVVGLGPVSLAAIMEARRKNVPIEGRAKNLLANPRTKIDTLYPVRDAVARLYPNGLRRTNGLPIKSIADVKCGLEGEFVIVAVADKLTQNDLNSVNYVARRNGKKYTGPTLTLSVIARDDTDDIFCWVDRFEFNDIGKAMFERGRAGKALYAIRGTVPRGDFRMVRVSAVKYLGDMEEGRDGRRVGDAPPGAPAGRALATDRDRVDGGGGA